MLKQLGLLSLAGMFAACLGASTALAGYVAQLESIQNMHGVQHQWKFEGAADANRLRDTTANSSKLHLLRLHGPGGTGSVDPDATPDTGDEYTYDYTPAVTGFDANSIIFETGFDLDSQAYRPSGMSVTSANSAEALAQRRAGAALYSDGNYVPPTTMTVETVVKPGLYDDNMVNGGPVHYVLQQRGAGDYRGYYLAQQPPDSSRGAGGSLTAALGSSLGSQVTRPRIEQDYSDQGHWYYVAVTYDMSGGAASPAVVNAWVADLTAGTPLEQTLTNFAMPGVLSAGHATTAAPLGVGMFYNPATPQEFFRGAIDNLAIYNKTLTPEQIALSFRALTVLGVPEPTSVVLLALGGLALAACRRRVA